MPPVWVALAAERLAGTPVRVGTVVGFPLGYVHPEVRLAESRRAVADGAQELDTVLNLSWLKGGEDERVRADLAGWVGALRAERAGLTLKVILETALLTDEEKRRGALLAADAGADFVKTSTGFALRGRDGRRRRPARRDGRRPPRDQGLRRHPRRRHRPRPPRRRRHPPRHLQRRGDPARSGRRRSEDQRVARP